MKPKHLFAIFLTLFILLVSGIEAKTRKGEKLLKAGQAAEARGDWDKALDLYEQAVDTDPGDIGYLVPMRKARFEAGQVHVKAGQKLRTEGKLEEAVQEFQRALIADPSSSIALQEIKRIQQMLRAPAKTGAKADERGLSPAELSRRQSDDRVESMLGPPELKPMTAVIPVLKMNNQPPKVLFETVAKLAGVNVVFDSQYQAPMRNFNVDLSNATADQAFDYLATLTHTFWKAITPNTIFVAEDNVTKRRDYEDDVVKVFYVTNATTVQEFQEIATAIRTVAEIRRVFTYNAQRAMIVRDTVDKVALAEKLVHDLDKPKSEVVVDVMVMQVNSERTRDLAATIASAGTAGLNVPINFAPAGTTTTTSTGANGTPTPTTTGNTVTLAQLGRLSTADFSTTLPGGLLQAMLSDSRTRVLNQPQVRASDGQKVSLKIGSRIPYATGSFGSTLGGVGAGVSPLVSTQFNYADVGVQVDMTPQVHSTDEVTLHIEVTVSSVQQYINIGGISQPIIQQSANIADIRLREGEVNILGGLSQSQDTSLVNGIPGLVNIPVLGRTLFGSDHTDKIRAEMMIALVPHIVRTPAYTAENLRGIYAGTDQVVKINYAPKDDGPMGSILELPGAAPTLVAVAPAAAPPATGVAIMPGAVRVSPPAASPIAPANAAAGPSPARIMPMPMTAAATPAAVVAGPAARVSFSPSTVQAADGATVKVNVQVENGATMNSVAPLRIKYDPALLRLEDIAPGDIFSRGGGGATSSKDIQNDAGEASITIERLPGAPAVNGPGTLAVLTFTAIGSGQAPVTIEEVALKDSQSQPVAASTAALGVQIQ